jgi:hypothetical protein
MAWAAILAVPTAIAGIYGMKFEHMPEPTYGYYMNLLRLHRAVWRFRRNGWYNRSPSSSNLSFALISQPPSPPRFPMPSRSSFRCQHGGKCHGTQGER